MPVVIAIKNIHVRKLHRGRYLYTPNDVAKSLLSPRRLIEPFFEPGNPIQRIHIRLLFSDSLPSLTWNLILPTIFKAKLYNLGVNHLLAYRTVPSGNLIGPWFSHVTYLREIAAALSRKWSRHYAFDWNFERYFLAGKVIENDAETRYSAKILRFLPSAEDQVWSPIPHQTRTWLVFTVRFAWRALPYEWPDW